MSTSSLSGRCTQEVPAEVWGNKTEKRRRKEKAIKGVLSSQLPLYATHLQVIPIERCGNWVFIHVLFLHHWLNAALRAIVSPALLAPFLL